MGRTTADRQRIELGAHTLPYRAYSFERALEGIARADFPIPGEGGVDHERLFRTLLAAGFSGPALVERLDGAQNVAAMSVEMIDAALSTARANMARAIAAAGG